MLKAITLLAIVAALLTGCTPRTPHPPPQTTITTTTKPSGDPVSNAISLFAGQPGMVDYLNEMRSIGWVDSVEKVVDAAKFGLTYCGSSPELQAVYADAFTAFGPDIAARWKTAQDQLCDTIS